MKAELWLNDGMDEQSTYTVNGMGGISEDLAGDWQKGMKDIIQQMIDGCKNYKK